MCFSRFAPCVDLNASSLCVCHVRNEIAQRSVAVREKKRQNIEQRRRNGGGRNLELLGSRRRFPSRESFPTRHSFLRENFGKLGRIYRWVVPKSVQTYIVIETSEKSKKRGQKVRVDKIPLKLEVKKSGFTKFRVTFNG